MGACPATRTKLRSRLGLLTRYLGWRAVFLVNPPLIAIMLTLIGRLPASARVRGTRVDVRGALLVTVALAALIFGLSNGQQNGFSAPATIVALVATGLAVLGLLLQSPHRLHTAAI